MADPEKPKDRLWDFVEKTAKEVHDWPSWKNGGEKPQSATSPKVPIRRSGDKTDE